MDRWESFYVIVMSVPWPSLAFASVVVASCGIAGAVYSVVVVIRARRQTFYTPVWQDWLWYAALPFVAYGSLSIAALMLRVHAADALLGIGAAALGLLLIGIHNAWDSVIHLVVGGAAADNVEGE
ncbi:MAG TPA: hypothetical protein VLV86_26210 [Vicinamibacterales bacterium]|nr:hypothetical protein [Vicinamibacterales bacterium]